jgi:cell fate regulator YaaT (PSP1 superfamily)
MDMPSNYKPFNIVEVRFKGSRKDFFVNVDNLYLEMGEMVVVEPSTGGYDVGHISLTGELVRLQLKKNNVTPEMVTKKIYRKPNEIDVEKYNAAKDLEWETMHKARKLALDLGLSMKISDVDYQGDKTKATFYYTAEGRVDFRELIKKMAEAFRIRIEMRQIGMRQEASRLGGIGSCGRELCCSTWLTDFKTVSTSAARYQNLSLNTLKLAGQCGKLKCCLNYELDSYMDALKDIPNNIDRIETQKGVAYLQKTDIFKKMMWFSFPGAENWIALPVQQVKELVEMNKQGVKPEAISSAIDTDEIREEKNINYDYENVVGQDSLTRLDDRNKRKKKRKTKSSTAKPENKVGTKTERSDQNSPRQGAKPQSVASAPASEGTRENKEGTSNRPKKRFNRHRNKNKGNNNNTAPKAE